MSVKAAEVRSENSRRTFADWWRQKAEKRARRGGIASVGFGSMPRAWRPTAVHSYFCELWAIEVFGEFRISTLHSSLLPKGIDFDNFWHRELKKTGTVPDAPPLNKPVRNRVSESAACVGAPAISFP